MGYAPRKTVYRLAREQLHLNKAKLWWSKFPYLDQWESCFVSQPFVSSCRFYGLRATGQNIRYSGLNCALGPLKSIRYMGDFVPHILLYNSAGLSYVVHYNGVFVIARFVIAECHHCIQLGTTKYNCLKATTERTEETKIDNDDQRPLIK